MLVRTSKDFIRSKTLTPPPKQVLNYFSFDIAIFEFSDHTACIICVSMHIRYMNPIDIGIEGIRNC